MSTSIIIPSVLTETNNRVQGTEKATALVDNSRFQGQSRTLLFLAAGTAASVSCGTFNPLDCLRVRWQVSPPATGGLVSFGCHIVQTEGFIHGLWKPGLGANVTGMALSAAMRFGYYETVRDTLVQLSRRNPHPNSLRGHRSHEEEILTNKGGVHMVAAGTICGSVAYGITAPFHFLKTMIQAEKSLLDRNGRYVGGSRMGKRPYSTDIRTGMTRIIQDHGVLGLWKGSLPLMTRGALFTSGQMLGYDGTKTLAKGNGYFVVEDGPCLHVVSSVFASLGASFLSAPADYVMAKYMTSSNRKSGLVSCIGKLYKTNGITGFWKGWSIFFIRLTPVMLTYSTLYEQLRCQFGLGYLT